MTGIIRRASAGLLLLLGLTTLAQGQEAGDLPAGIRQDERGAIARNLVLPGWGFMSLDRTDLARSALIREASLIIGYTVLASASNWYRQDMRSYGAEHAGAQYRERDSIYYFRMARYPSLEAYNQAMLRQRNINDVYPQGKGWEWSWDDEARMDTFEQLRVNSLNAAKGARFAIGGLIVNRVAAAVQVLFVTRREPPVQAFLVPMGNGLQLQLHLNL